MKHLHINLILAFILLAITIYFLFDGCNCNNLERENMSNLNYASLDYLMSEGVSGDNWNKPFDSNLENNYDLLASLSANKAGKVPLPDGEMDLFYNNIFDPECCFKPQNYSSSSGCACISEEQMKYLNQRAGNNNIEN